MSEEIASREMTAREFLTTIKERCSLPQACVGCDFNDIMCGKPPNKYNVNRILHIAVINHNQLQELNKDRKNVSNFDTKKE